MTREEREAIRARCEAATPGPWAEGVSDATTRAAQLARLAERLLAGPREVFPCVWVPTHPGTKIGDDPERPMHAVVVCDTGNGPNGDANTAFIAAARTDVPALLAEVDRLEAERDTWKAEHEAMCIDARDARYRASTYADERDTAQRALAEAERRLAEVSAGRAQSGDYVSADHHRRALAEATAQNVALREAVRIAIGDSGMPVDTHAELSAALSATADTSALMALLVTAANIGHQNGETGDTTSPLDVALAVLKGER